MLSVPADRQPSRRDRRRIAQRPEPPDGGGAVPDNQLGELVARLTDDSVGRSDRSRQLAALTRALSGSARGAGVRAVAAGRWLADVVAEVAPRVPVRDQATLRSHHPGRTDDEIAEALARGAMTATAALGAAAGALAAAEFAAPPTLLAAPVQLAAETVAIAAVEIKLVAELHELYGEGVAGPLSQRGSQYLMSWVRQRAVEPATGGGVAALLGAAAKRELRSRLMRRMGRSTTSLAPFLAGAAAGAEVNRRGTRSLADKLVAELRGRQGRRWSDR